MPIVVQCPSCMARIKVPDSRIGERVKCPGCKFQFLTAKQPPAPVPAAPKPSADPFDFYTESEPDPPSAEKSESFAEIAAVQISEPPLWWESEAESAYLLAYILSGLAFVVGLVWTTIALVMDTTVDTGTEFGRVHNIGRLADRQNHLLIAGAITALAVIVFVATWIAHQFAGRSSEPDSRPIAADSTLDALEKLAELKAKGILTEAEFQEQKRKLLS